jgi:hypothetical protein
MVARMSFRTAPKGWPLARRRIDDAVLNALDVKDRKIAPAEFSGVFAPLFSRPSSNKGLKVDPRGRYSNSLQQLITQFHGLVTDMPHDI